MPKGEFDTPGPFSCDESEIYRDVEGHKFGYQRTVALCVDDVDEAEVKELVGLLNKGTHFEGMLAALKYCANAKELYHIERAHDSARAAIAKAGGKDDADEN